MRYINLHLTFDTVHAFVTSHVDYCNVVLAGAPKVITNKLQRMMNAAIRVLTGNRKFDRGLTQPFSIGLTCLSASSTKSSSWLVAASSVPRHGI